MTLQEMIHVKKQYGLSNETIASLSGVPLSTVMKVFSGQTRHPRRETLLALERAFIKECASHDDHYPSQAQDPFSARESQAGYGKALAPVRTIDDYYALPDDVRVELIDGIFYDMAAPSIVHQTLLVELAMHFRRCIDEHDCSCRVLPAPCNVQLDGDRYTMVQPDILIVCDKEKLHEKACIGAPDLVTEIVSPSSVGRDCLIKLNKYRSAGVREYWIVDPSLKKIHVYHFENSDSFAVYTFRDDIPVGISGGRCIIRFSEIDDYLTD